jgi:hypothetical protein
VAELQRALESGGVTRGGVAPAASATGPIVPVAEGDEEGADPGADIGGAE